MQRHDWSSTSPKEPMLHLSLSPCTGYQLQLASSSRHWCLHLEQPQAQHPPTSTHYYEFTSPPEVWDLLVSDASWYHHRGSKSLSRTFSFTVPGWWNELPTPIRNAGRDPVNLQATTENSSLYRPLDFIIEEAKKKVTFFYIFIFLSFSC